MSKTVKHDEAEYTLKWSTYDNGSLRLDLVPHDDDGHAKPVEATADLDRHYRPPHTPPHVFVRDDELLKALEDAKVLVHVGQHLTGEYSHVSVARLLVEPELVPES